MTDPPFHPGPKAKPARRRRVPGLAVAVMVAVLAMSWSAPAAAAENFVIDDFTFVKPLRWERMTPSSPVRRAQFRVPNPVGDEGFVIFYRFLQGTGGSVDRNIQRWYSHFKEPNEALGAKIELKTNGERRLYYFRASGTYLGGAGEIPDYALYGAILEDPWTRVFIRMLAPRNLAADNESAFRRLIENALRN